jgi:uncharacterized protein YxjI
MYSYPLTFTFPAFAISPQITARDVNGKVVLTAAKKLISSKDEINVTSGGQPLYKITSQENRITDIPSNWDVMTTDSKPLGVVDDDFLSAIDTSKFVEAGAWGGVIDRELQRALNLKALKMYWIKEPAGKKLGLIAPDQNSMVAAQLPLYQVVRKLPFFFRFITPHYYVRLGEQTVMVMQKKRTFFTDTYILEARGKFSDQEEALLINSVLLALVYERQRLKDLYQ